MRQLSVPVKVSVIGISVGVALIGLLAAYFKRRKRGKVWRDLPPVEEPTLRNRRSNGTNLSPTARTPNGDLSGSRQSTSPFRNHSYRDKSTSLSSLGGISNASTLTVGGNNHDSINTANMGPDALCELGLESLQAAIDHWQEALSKIDQQLAETNTAMEPPMSELQQQVQELLNKAFKIQEDYEYGMFRQASTAALDSAISAIADMDKRYNAERRRTRSLDEGSSDQDSFVSAIDMADLSDLEEHREAFQHLVLYEAALLELKHGSIPIRSLRTKMAKCLTDTEFVAKVFCVRAAFELLFRDETIQNYFIEEGKKMITDLLTHADRDAEDFQEAYDILIEYVKNKDNWPEMEEELRFRGVKLLSFYDVVLDFIMMDAFDDLENPPTSVTAVVQNRWLSNGFKETALSTAVWSVLKAKRRLLKFPNGFISKFYGITEHVSPVMAWGFLGPDGKLKQLCNYFKDQVLGFVGDIFSFEQVRYTTVEELSDDILSVGRMRVQKAAERLAV